VVPLVVIEGAAMRSLPWSDAVAVNKDKASHYNIFPTLLMLMGYDQGQARAAYGDPLHLPVRDELSFNTTFHARLGMKPTWKRIDLDRIAKPVPE
jgi:hypothetical protein